MGVVTRGEREVHEVGAGRGFHAASNQPATCGDARQGAGSTTRTRTHVDAGVVSGRIPLDRNRRATFGVMTCTSQAGQSGRAVRQGAAYTGAIPPASSVSTRSG